MVGLYEIFALEQKRLADEAYDRGDDRARITHIAQADRFGQLQRQQNAKERREKDRAALDAMPRYVSTDERKENARYGMSEHAHLHREGTILCADRQFRHNESNSITSVRFRPDMTVDRFSLAFKKMNFYKKLCCDCIVEAKLIRQGVVD